MNTALDMGEENKNLGPAQKLKEKFDLIAAIDEEKKRNKKGFFTQFYVPWFIKMKEDQMTEAASFIAYLSSEDKDIKGWVEENKTKVDSFYKWFEGYVWVKK